jgi:hypothetical protein
MYKVEVANQCGCFKKSEYTAEKSFEDINEAIAYTEALTELMNEEFCGKHNFTPLTVAENHVQIVFGGGHGGGCCGGGHCG